MKYALSLGLGLAGLVLMGFGMTTEEADAMHHASFSLTSTGTLEWFLGAGAFGLGFCMNTRATTECGRMRVAFGTGAVLLGAFFLVRSGLSMFSVLEPEDLFREFFVNGMVGFAFVVTGALMGLIQPNEAEGDKATNAVDPDNSPAAERHDSPCGCDHSTPRR